VRALGRTIDAGLGWTPTNAATAGITGKRVSLKNATSVIFLVNAAAAASGTDALTFTISQHTAATGGSTANLAVIADYHWKVAASTTMDGTETWARVTQAAAATVVIAGSNATKEALIAIEVNAVDLTSGYSWVSISVSQPSVARYVAAQTLLSDLITQRRPANLPATLSV